jgi:hypothetical protein
LQKERNLTIFFYGTLPSEWPLKCNLYYILTFISTHATSDFVLYYVMITYDRNMVVWSVTPEIVCSQTAMSLSVLSVVFLIAGCMSPRNIWDVCKLRDKAWVVYTKTICPTVCQNDGGPFIAFTCRNKYIVFDTHWIERCAILAFVVETY